MTDPNGRLRPRLVDAIASAIAEEAEHGRYTPPAPPSVLADGIVALGERFLYHGGNPEFNPDPATATLVIRLLVREPCNDAAS